MGEPDAQRHGVATLRGLVRYFLGLGTFGFGGPIALAGYMQRDLVEKRGWITEEEYRRGLALAQLAPGPLAAQLAMYLGWVRARVIGATLVSLAFVLPSFVMVLVLAATYVELGGISWMQGVFYGIGAAVIAIIARSVQKLTKLTLAKDPLLWVVFVANGAVTALTESEIVSSIGGAAIVLGRRAIFDIPTIAIAVSTFAVLYKVKKVPEPLVIVAAGLVGVAIMHVR